MSQVSQRVESEYFFQVIDQVLRKVRASAPSEIRIPGEFFWSVPLDDLFETSREPELTIGQLEEVLENLTTYIQCDEDDGMHGLLYLSDLLRAATVSPYANDESA